MFGRRVLIGIVGIVLIQRPQFGGGQIAVAAALVSSLTSAVALIGLHQVRELDPRAVVVHFSGVALALLHRRAVCVSDDAMFSLDLRTVALLLGVGVTRHRRTALFDMAFAAGPPARVSVVGLSQVGFTMLLEMAIWHRSFSGHNTGRGSGLVIAPTVWTLLRGVTQHGPIEGGVAAAKGGVKGGARVPHRLRCRQLRSVLTSIPSGGRTRSPRCVWCWL